MCVQSIRECQSRRCWKTSRKRALGPHPWFKLSPVIWFKCMCLNVMSWCQIIYWFFVLCQANEQVSCDSMGIFVLQPRELKLLLFPAPGSLSVTKQKWWRTLWTQCGSPSPFLSGHFAMETMTGKWCFSVGYFLLCQSGLFKKNGIVASNFAIINFVLFFNLLPNL